MAKNWAYRRLALRFLILLLSLLVCVQVLEARIRHYKWEVKYEYKSPDCYNKLVITVNGETPGPTIIAQQNDTIVVELTNRLATENLATHWHGIRQKETPWFDGTEGVTQCPILPGETFIYNFVVDRPGTYLYHAHYGMQRDAGVYGMIHVSLPEGEREPFSYDHEKSVLLTDWYHKSTFEQAAGLSAIPFQWVGEPESILINGRGRFNCSTVGIEAGRCNATNPECSPYTTTVVPGKTYRFRIGSLAALSALSFHIEGHNMTVVEADGNYVEPFMVENLFIYSGETYSVLVTPNHTLARNFWITASVICRNSTTPQGLGILNIYPTHPKKAPHGVPPAGFPWNDVESRFAQSRAINSLKSHAIPPPRNSDKQIVLLNTQNEVDGRRKWCLNNVSLTLPETPYLVALKYSKHSASMQKVAPAGYDMKNYDIYSVASNPNATMSDAIYKLPFRATIDIILQNANTMTPNKSETHPWHLHGHDFWVLGYGKGKFNTSKHGKTFNLKNPIMKNTVPLHPYGWTALRFKADNPGVWAFHCHIESHFYMGMGVVFEEGIEEVGHLPSSIMGCGATKPRAGRP